MKGLANLKDILKSKGEQFINMLLKQYVVITEQVDGSRFCVQRTKKGLVYYKGSGSKPINLIDRTLMIYYERAISYIEGIPMDVQLKMPLQYKFGFQYLDNQKPHNIEYDRLPDNNLIITDIQVLNNGKVVKTITDTKILTDWAKLFIVQKPPVIFKGNLNDHQKQKIREFLKTPDEDLVKIFKTQSFTRFIVTLLNTSLKRTALMNNLDKSVESIVFKFIEGKKSFTGKVIDPIFLNKAQSIEDSPKRKSNDTYQIAMLDIVEHLQGINLKDISLKGDSSEKRYIELISILFNDYIEKNGYKFIGVDFQVPEFAKGDGFKLNTSFIENQRTIEILRNTVMQDLYKIFLGSFKKERKHSTALLTDTVIASINELVSKIKGIIEDEPEANEVKDFMSFLGHDKIATSDTVFEQLIFEGVEPAPGKENPGNKKVNIFVGRFQPFTTGHLKALESVYKKNRLPVVICLVKGKKSGGGPFDMDMQLSMLRLITKSYKFIESVVVISTGFIEDIINELRPVYEPVLWATGTDRYSSYKSMIKRYASDLNITDLDIFEIPRGDEDVSATKVRAALGIDDKETFLKMTPKAIHRMYDELKMVIEPVSEKHTKTFYEVINESEVLNESKIYSSDEEVLNAFAGINLPGDIMAQIINGEIKPIQKTFPRGGGNSYSDEKNYTISDLENILKDEPELVITCSKSSIKVRTKYSIRICQTGGVELLSDGTVKQDTDFNRMILLYNFWSNNKNSITVVDKQAAGIGYENMQIDAINEAIDELNPNREPIPLYINGKRESRSVMFCDEISGVPKADFVLRCEPEDYWISYKHGEYYIDDDADGGASKIPAGEGKKNKGVNKKVPFQQWGSMSSLVEDEYQASNPEIKKISDRFLGDVIANLSHTKHEEVTGIKKEKKLWYFKRGENWEEVTDEQYLLILNERGPGATLWKNTLNSGKPWDVYFMTSAVSFSRQLADAGKKGQILAQKAIWGKNFEKPGGPYGENNVNALLQDSERVKVGAIMTDVNGETELTGIDISPTRAGHWVESPTLPDDANYNPTLCIRHTKGSDFGLTEGGNSLILGGRYLIMPYGSTSTAKEI
tara:strand:+ start:4564 stop:7821 length:3258 start_codon:yes stop_codon:yes gene_type:complete